MITDHCCLFVLPVAINLFIDSLAPFPFPPHHLRIIVQTENKAAVKDLRHFSEAFPELVGTDPLFSQGGDLCFQLPDGDGDKVVAV